MSKIRLAAKTGMACRTPRAPRAWPVFRRFAAAAWLTALTCLTSWPAAGQEPATSAAETEAVAAGAPKASAYAASSTGLPTADAAEDTAAPPLAPSADVVAETTATLATTSVPLGLVDAFGILRAAESLLDASDGATSAPVPRARIGQAAARVEVVARYMEQLAVAMREQVRYEWYSAGRSMGVRPGAGNKKRLALGAVQQGVEAVRVRALSASVRVDYLWIEGARNDSLALTPGVELAGDLPKWEVLFLGVPIDATAVTVAARHPGKEKRRLLVEVGVPQTPDYAREVAALCRLCQGQWSNGENGEARETLARAVKRLNDFRASLANIRSRKPAADAAAPAHP